MFRTEYLIEINETPDESKTLLGPFSFFDCVEKARKIVREGLLDELKGKLSIIRLDYEGCDVIQRRTIFARKGGVDNDNNN